MSESWADFAGIQTRIGLWLVSQASGDASAIQQRALDAVYNEHQTPGRDSERVVEAAGHLALTAMEIRADRVRTSPEIAAEMLARTSRAALPGPTMLAGVIATTAQQFPASYEARLQPMHLMAIHTLLFTYLTLAMRYSRDEIRECVCRAESLAMRSGFAPPLVTGDQPG